MRVFSLPPRSIREVEVNWFANKRTKKKKKKSACMYAGVQKHGLYFGNS